MSIYHFYQGKDENEGLDLEQQKQNISSFIKAQFSAENLVFFIGSGCSVPAIPLMSQTMKTIIGKHGDILFVIKQYLMIKRLLRERLYDYVKAIVWKQLQIYIIILLRANCVIRKSC